MNSLDDVLHNRVVSAARIEDGTLLIVLDGGEALWVAADRPDSGVHWRYSTNPHPRELLGLGAPSRPRGGHGRPLEDRSPAEVVDEWAEGLRMSDRIGFTHEVRPDWPKDRSVVFRCRGCRSEHAVTGEARLDCVCGTVHLFRWAEDEPERRSASVVPRDDLGVGAHPRQVRVTGHSSNLVPDGVYERVGD